MQISLIMFQFDKGKLSQNISKMTAVLALKNKYNRVVDSVNSAAEFLPRSDVTWIQKRTTVGTVDSAVEPASKKGRR